MNITECVPLAGRGLVARRGHLVALTDGMDVGPDPLLTVLTAVAYANGDGAALVLAGSRAAAERGGRPAWACAGVTFGEEVAVLVHGEAVALVSVDGSPEAQVTASGSMIPVVGTFTGAVVPVRLVLGPPALAGGGNRLRRRHRAHHQTRQNQQSHPERFVCVCRSHHAPGNGAGRRERRVPSVGTGARGPGPGG